MMTASKRCSLTISLAISLASSSFGRSQALPEGKGKAEFERVCSGCHTVAMSTRVGRSHDDWAGIVNDMVGRGAQGSRNDLDAIIAYLSTNFNKEAGAQPAGQVGPAQAVRPPYAPPIYDPLPPVNPKAAAKVASLIRINNCLACHRLEGAGSYQGPRLDGIGSHRTADQIRAAMIAPALLVSPENRSVRFITRNGKTVSGRILNQDGFSVQLVDTSDRLVTFQKADLREFTIIDKNTMPSYGNRISPQDLETLVHYLGSLGELAQ